MANETLEEQLKRLNFNPGGWGRAEVDELKNIILPGEQIYEMVNGIYDGGFALLVTTNVRVLLIDKKPLKYLTVEDLRFDMINEIDYSHRMFGAQISISAGNKNLTFRSYNQPRLRKAINHVQACMAEAKQKLSAHQEDQNVHLQQINNQLQAYLLAQHEQQARLRQQLEQARQSGNYTAIPEPEPIKPPPELSDYLYAQSLLRQNNVDLPVPEPAPPAQAAQVPEPSVSAAEPEPPEPVQPAPIPVSELYQEGIKEVFGKANAATSAAASAAASALVVNPLRIAYSRLPMAMRNRKFGRPSFHAHSQSAPQPRPAR